MTIQKYIEHILNYFISKFYLENNNAQALVFENVKEAFKGVILSANEGKLAPSKKHFSHFILLLKENVMVLNTAADRRLLRSLIAFTFMVRRDANKQKSYSNVFNLNIDELKYHTEFSKAKLISDDKKVTLSYPRKK